MRANTSGEGVEFAIGDPRILKDIRQIVHESVSVRASDVDEYRIFPEESYQALARAGLGGLQFKVEYGGRGASSTTYAAAMEEIAAACASTSTVYMTQSHCAHPIDIAGTSEQKERYIPPLCRGEMYGAIALTEPNAGSDVASMTTYARREGDAYVLNGGKIFISNGDRADVVVLFATVDRKLGREGITAFLLERKMSGFSSGQPIHKLGQRGASTVELFLSDCRIPISSRLGPEGSGYSLLIQSMMKSRISAAAQGVGLARGAVEDVAAYFSQRGVLDSRRRDAQDVQFALAGMKAKVDAARAMLFMTTREIDQSDGDHATEIAEMKLYCSDVGVDVSSEAVELLGEDGDRIDLGVERRLRDVKVTQIYDGTNQVQRMLIARGMRREYV